MEQNKDRVVAMLLAFFLGGFGAHQFYLGRVGRGVLYFFFFWTAIPFFVAFVDFLMLAFMEKKKFDYKYNPHLFNRGQRQQPMRDSWNMNAARPATGPSYRQTATRKERKLNKYEKITQKVNNLRSEILEKIKTSDEYHSDIIEDIKPLVDKYIAQVSELIARDKKLESVLRNNPPEKINDAILELNQKLGETRNLMLQNEYKKAIEKHQKHKQTLKEFIEQREMINLRLDSTVMSLNEIKFDLIKMENLAADDQREKFFELFDEKSNDLSNYLEILKETYDESAWE